MTQRARGQRGSSGRRNKVLAIVVVAAIAMLALLFVGYRFPRDETESLQKWVEKQNFIFLVPARGGFLPGDIVQWPPATPGKPRSGDVMLYETSARVLGPSSDDIIEQTRLKNVTLTDSIEAGLRSGALPGGVSAEAQLKGIQSFDLVMKDVLILEAPLASLQQAVAGRPELAAALNDPNRTMITRILRPASFQYRFKREGQTGFAASLKRLFGGRSKDPTVESGGTFVTSVQMHADKPLVVGIAIATLDLKNVGTNQPRAELRSLEFEESRALQPGANAALWPVGSTLRVRFLNGTPEQKRLFQEAMGEWLKYANLHVGYVRSGGSDIRVEFTQDGANWSYVGRNAVQLPQDKATIALGYPVGATGSKGAYLHEIGHALGLVHEFQNPQAQALYNRDALINQLHAQGMTDEQIRFMFFDSDSYPGSRPVDLRSVMSYPLPPQSLKGGRTFAPGDDLSPSDRGYVTQLYPREA